MCRYDYVDGVKRDNEEQEEAQRWQLEEEAHRRREDELVRFQQHYVEHQRQLEEEEQMRQEEEQMRREEEPHHYSFYQDLNRQFNGNYKQAVDEAARIWKDFAGLDQATQDSIYEKLEQAAGYRFYIYSQLRRVMYHNEDGIIRNFDSSFDVCRVVYLSKIITQPENMEAYERLKEFEEWADEEMELDNWW
jgi:hypothetical protein